MVMSSKKLKERHDGVDDSAAAPLALLGPAMADVIAGVVFSPDGMWECVACNVAAPRAEQRPSVQQARTRRRSRNNTDQQSFSEFVIQQATTSQERQFVQDLWQLRRC